MAKRQHYLLPPEWKTAWESLALIQEQERSPRAARWIRSALGFGIPFGVAASTALFLLPQVLGEEKDVLISAAGAILAFTGLILGFGVTLMLFIGKVESVQMLTLEELQAYSRRIKYLLAFQVSTLFSALLASIGLLLWMLLLSGGAGTAVLTALGSVVSGFTGVCLARSFLMPLQIYELHETWLQDAVDAKERELADRYRARADACHDD